MSPDAGEQQIRMILFSSSPHVNCEYFCTMEACLPNAAPDVAFGYISLQKNFGFGRRARFHFFNPGANCSITTT